ncbi:hypothetical protein ES695_08235 [Candidatus Atribacteria bacterium 1244-E10-H5-B2]|nr:MAG: hypothetical protein ES695_08235 [Candidatus Atribacteria bacterium 1244-E10-H5-B2]
MRKFENLLIVFIVIMLLAGLWILYLSFKIEKNELLIKILISRDGTNLELIGAIQDRLERLEGRYSDFEENRGLQPLSGYP